MDALKIQIKFRKGIFTCSNCGQEDIVDFNVSGGNTYENNCSFCGTWSNKFINYDGLLTMSKDEYEAKKSEDIVQMKKDKVDAFIEEKKNPPIYIGLTVKELEQLKQEKLKEVEELSNQISVKSNDIKEVSK